MSHPSHLFRPAVVDQHVAALPEKKRRRIDSQHHLVMNWVEELQSRRLFRYSESDCEQAFNEQIFCKLLGYRDIATGRGERTFKPKDNRADFGLGWYGGNTPVRVAVGEIKDARTDLDEVQPRKRPETPVDQAFRYARSGINIKWVIVTNFVETRLYRNGSMVRYERFLLEELADPVAFKRFHTLLAAENLLPDANGASTIERLLTESDTAEEELTESFYALYSLARQELLAALLKDNPGIPGEQLVAAAQKILDRAIFICFCEDHPQRILPRNLLRETMAGAKRGKIWPAVRRLFGAIDKGATRRGIFAFNGGLFKKDPVISKLVVRDSLFTKKLQAGSGGRRSRQVHGILGFHEYDFNSELDVNLLGHIFEQSVTDLEQLRAALTKSRRPTAIGKRRRQGVYYTPEWVTRYIVESCLGPLFESRLAEARREATTAQAKRGRRGSLSGRAARQHLAYANYIRALKQVRICDLACGSGAFLNQAHEVLREEYLRARGAMESLAGRTSLLFEFNPRILERNLYGADLSAESVEISKLALWLKSAQPQQPLTFLADRILCGDSLFERGQRRGRRQVTMAPAFEQQTFDVIVGNPPWGADLSGAPQNLAEQYALAAGQYDSYELFIERALDRLEEGGILGYIVPDSLFLPEHRSLRELLLKKTRLLKVVRLGEGVFRHVFRAAAILILQKGRAPPAQKTTCFIVTRKQREEAVGGQLNLAQIEAERGHPVRQRRFTQNRGLELDIFVDRHDEKVLRKLEKRSLHWEEFLYSTRGVEITKEGSVLRCPRCLLWDNVPRRNKAGEWLAKTCHHCGHQFPYEKALAHRSIITRSKPRRGTAIPVHVGETVSRYHLGPPRWIDPTLDGVRYKDRDLYRGPKLLFRKTGVGIWASLDASDAMTTQVVYIFKPRPEAPQAFPLSYFLGVVSSRLLLYYRYKKSGDVEWKSFPYITQEQIGALPVRRPTATQENLVQGIAKAAGRLMKVKGKRARERLDWQIERMVMDLYGISAREMDTIWNAFAEVQGLRIVREMFPDGSPAP